MNPDEAAEKVRAAISAAHEEATTLRERVATLTRELDEAINTAGKWQRAAHEASEALARTRARVADMEGVAGAGAGPFVPRHLRDRVPATDALDVAWSALRDLLDYEGGADNALDDEHVVKRARDALAAIAAAKASAVPVAPRPDVPSVEEVRRCLTRLSEGPLYTWDPCIDGVQDTERTLRRLARACGLEVG